MILSTKRMANALIILIFILTNIFSLAEDKNINGYDWVKWSDDEKAVFITMFRLTSKIDNAYSAEMIINRVDAFYYGIFKATDKGLDEKEADNIFNAPCVKLIPIILTLKESK